MAPLAKFALGRIGSGPARPWGRPGLLPLLYTVKWESQIYFISSRNGLGIRRLLD
ncbi:hypothetical protein [Caudoviricetes sp.]|nr:hypothetical protein [Caudoviricetes sp.]